MKAVRLSKAEHIRNKTSKLPPT